LITHATSPFKHFAILSDSTSKQHKSYFKSKISTKRSQNNVRRRGYFPFFADPPAGADAAAGAPPAAGAFVAEAEAEEDAFLVD